MNNSIKEKSYLHNIRCRLLQFVLYVIFHDFRFLREENTITFNLDFMELLHCLLNNHQNAIKFSAAVNQINSNISYRFFVVRCEQDDEGCGKCEDQKGTRPGSYFVQRSHRVTLNE